MNGSNYSFSDAPPSALKYVTPPWILLLPRALPPLESLDLAIWYDPPRGCIFFSVIMSTITMCNGLRTQNQTRTATWSLKVIKSKHTQELDDEHATVSPSFKDIN